MLPCDRRETESQRAQPAWHVSQCSSQTCPSKEGHLPQRGVPVASILGSSEECGAVRKGRYLRPSQRASWDLFSPRAMQGVRAHLCRMGWPPLVRLPWPRPPPALHKPLRDTRSLTRQMQACWHMPRAVPRPQTTGWCSPAVDKEPWPALCVGTPAAPRSPRLLSPPFTAQCWVHVRPWVRASLCAPQCLIQGPPYTTLVSIRPAAA